MGNEQKTKSADGKIHWVGIGASAGGLEALRGFVRKLQTDLPATYIIAQHMAPHHRSMLSEIIRRETDMAVLDVTDNLLPEANTVYITPPNSNVVVKRNRVRLIDPSKKAASPKPSVDVFFESLAKAKKKLAVGIIMSGTGGDGAEGIIAINKHGGITIAQDELSAKYMSMPQAAIETGSVDLIMSPEEMGEQFGNIVSNPRELELLKSSPADLDAISELIRLLMVHTNVNFTHYKAPTLQRRVERRMAAVNVSDQNEYVKFARVSVSEIQNLYKDLLISVTSFFRDPAEFDALQKYVEKIVKDKAGQSIRVWVPGSATGEEAYSIAIMFFEAARKYKVSLDGKLQIFATDLDEEALVIARRGYYPETSLEIIPAEILERYFEPGPNGRFLKKIIREKLVFSIHNLAQDPPFLNLDMVSCRNLLIYFKSTLQAEVFSRFHYALVPNGLLFVGKSEAVMEAASMFRPADEEKHIFFQRPSHERKAPKTLIYDRPIRPTIKGVGQDTSNVKLVENSNARFESAVEALGPNGLLVDSDLQILRPFGDVEKYISINPGKVTNNVVSLLKSPFKQDVQFTVPAVIRNHKPSIGITHSNEKDPTQKERVMVYPLKGGADEEVLALVIFKSWQEGETTATSLPSAEADERIEELGNELAITKLNLQQTVEELETSNEELQALNEELQSSNEELQSTNEELETSNEELQSTNEELSTVNEELQVNSQQLNLVNHNLGGILQNLSIPLLVVDQNLHITNVSKASEDFFDIAPDLVLPHLARCRPPEGFPDIGELVRNAMETGERIQVEVNRGNSSSVLIVVPRFSMSDEAVGAIVIVSDNTKLLENTRTELQLIFDNVPSAIILRRRDGEILKANKMARELMDVEEIVDGVTNFYDYFAPETVGELMAIDHEILAKNETVTNLQREITYKDGRSIYASIDRIPGIHPETNEPVIYGITQNITEKYIADRKLEESERRLQMALNSGNLGIWEFDIKNDITYLSSGISKFLGIGEQEHSCSLQDIYDRIHPEDHGEWESSQQDHNDTRTPFSATYRMKRDDGEFIWVESSGKGTWDSSGKLVNFVGTLEDITLKRENYFAMKARDTQMSLAADLSGVGYWDLQLPEYDLFWSDQVYKIHGLTRSEYIPELESALSFYKEEEREDVRNKVNDAIINGKSFELQSSIKRDDGTNRFVRTIGTPNFDKDQRLIGIFGVFRDVTEDKNKEDNYRLALSQLSRSNDELTRFSYICSHDMKEPVRMIEAMSSLLLNPSYSEDDRKRVEMLKRINKNTMHLRTLIESLLAYSRIDAKIESSNVELSFVLMQVQSSISEKINHSGVKLQVSPLPKLWGAHVHFVQMFQNLIENAIQFRNPKDPRIEISSKKNDEGWSIYVDDNGPGVPEQARETIFELFGKLKRKDENLGRGLGLAVVRKIVEQYGGSVMCTDSPIGGARFEIFFPRRD